ncbi:hypothetical protein CE91St25_17980 [Campylobacter ureolyticus]|nr:hypothetical protein CE91St25_17980 [Campylobacter ureolyticus]
MLPLSKTASNKINELIVLIIIKSDDIMPIVKDFLGKKPAISDEVRGKNKEIRKKSIIFLS